MIGRGRSCGRGKAKRNSSLGQIFGTEVQSERRGKRAKGWEVDSQSDKHCTAEEEEVEIENTRCRATISTRSVGMSTRRTRGREQ